MKYLHYVAVAIVIIGAINWGLVGLAQYNLVHMLLGNYPMLERAVYLLVGAAGVFLAVQETALCATHCTDNRHNR